MAKATTGPLTVSGVVRYDAAQSEGKKMTDK